VYTMAAFGESLMEAPAGLRGSVLSATRDFVRHFDGTKLATLQTSMESDFWQPYPQAARTLRKQLAAIQELHPFLPRGSSPDALAPVIGAVRAHVPFPDTLEARNKAGTVVNPFRDYESRFLVGDTHHLAISENEVIDGEVSSDSDHSLDEAAKILTGSTLKAARLFGEYLNLMTHLPPMAHDAALGLFHLFSYYLLTVALLFSPSDAPGAETLPASTARIFGPSVAGM
jgi:hypothetical protein